MKRNLAIVVGVVVLLCVLALGLRGTGVLHTIRVLLHVGPKAPAVVPELRQPSVIAMSIDDASTGVDPASAIAVHLDLPNGSIDPKTVSDDRVGLFAFATRERLPATVKVVADGLLITPVRPMDQNRNYRLQILPGICDGAGQSLRQSTRSFFTTAQPPAGVAFKRIDQPAAKGEGFTCLNFGPDGKLYAATHDGKLCRFDVAADGTLSNKEIFTTLKDHEHGPRLFTGFTFDPKSPAGAPVIYLTSSEFGFGIPNPVTDFTGKIHRLSGSKFEKIEDLVINLPRSARDHATNQPKFGPDGALYIPQPSNTAVGGPDDYWYNRNEHGLNASILRLDVAAMTPGMTIDAKTLDSGGTFDWQSTNTPLTVYAMGLRMPYDLLWHSNGHLYTSVNGASARGATPAGVDASGTSVPGIARVSIAEHDWFFRIEKGRYYGHPNPIQKHFVLNGGNPTQAPDFNEVPDYPVGTQPDPLWTPAIYDFGMHVSADGMIEYKSDRFSGALKGKVIVCRYNVGSDLLCLGLDGNGNVATAVSGIPGFAEIPDPADATKTKKLVGPLDVIEDPRNGNIYVAEYHETQPSETRITLLRAIDSTTAAGEASH